MKLIGSIFIIVLLSGCVSTTTVCPTYPKPSKEVLTKIKSLQDPDVDSWMIDQFKLNKKLGLNNEI